jgi:hypothetical protein
MSTKHQDPAGGIVVARRARSGDEARAAVAHHDVERSVGDPRLDLDLVAQRVNHGVGDELAHEMLAALAHVGGEAPGEVLDGAARLGGRVLARLEGPARRLGRRLRASRLAAKSRIRHP